jgi:hypothetical protein
MSQDLTTSTIDPDLVEITSAALAGLAKHVAASGNAELADALVKQAADLELLSPDLQNCWGGPFNGQHGRTAIVAEILAAIQPGAVVETGTYRGITTEWFAEHVDVPVWSCEKEQLYWLQARHRLRSQPQVHLELSDSRAFLKRLVPTLDPNTPTLFYLDAHWESDLPLKDELRIIFGMQAAAVVLIDDFRVPDDPDYAWDDYGPDQRLDVSQFKDILPETAAIYFPSLRAKEEGGARRGCCVVAQNGSAAIDSCGLLRRWSLADALAAIATADSDTGPDIAEREPAPTGPSEALISGADALQALRTENAKINLDRAQRLNDVKRLTGQVDALGHEVELLRADRVLHLQDNEALTSQVLTLQQEVKSLTSDRLAQLRDNETLTDQLSHLQNEVKLLMSDRVAQLRDNESLATQLAALQTEIDLLRSERILQLRDNESLTARINETLSASERERAEHLAALEVLNLENKSLLGKIERLKTTCEADQDRISRLTAALLRLQTELEFRNVGR